MYNKPLTKLLIGIAIFLSIPGFAQEVSSDELLKQALNETNVNKNYPLAISLAEAGLKVSPDYMDIRLLLGKLFTLVGKDDEAIVEYNKVLAKEPLNVNALNALFNLNVRLGRNEDALLYADRLERTGSAPDILLKKADLLKIMGRDDDALQLAELLLAKTPGDPSIVYLYKEIQFSKGKDLLSSHDTASALLSYHNILKADPADTLARNLAINISLEKKDYPTAMNYISSGIPYYQDQSSIMLKKLNALQLSGELRQAYSLADSLMRNGETDSRITNIRNESFLLTRQNRIGISTSTTMFDQAGREPWSLHSVSYMRQEKNFSVLGRVNYADRVNRDGYQFELESYPKHGKSYSFVNMAYSDSRVFPKFKFSYSYFFPLSKSWESELGIRYLNARSDFKGLTGAVGKYLNKFWLNLKTFQTFSNGKLAGSYVFTSRHYFNDNSDDYLTGIAGYGFSPEDIVRNFDFMERVNLESLRFTLGYQKTILKRGILGLFGTVNNQEYTPGRKRNEFDVSVSFQHKF